MKKSDLIHVTVLIAAILLGYTALECLLGLLSLLTRWEDTSSGTVIYELVLTALFSLASVLLIRYSRQVTGVILKDEPANPEGSRWELDRRNILFVLFIGLGIFICIQAIAYGIGDFFDVYSNQVNPGAYKRVSIRNGLLIQSLRALMGFLLIYGAPNFTNLIERTIAHKLHNGSQSS